MRIQHLPLPLVTSWSLVFTFLLLGLLAPLPACAANLSAALELDKAGQRELNRGRFGKALEAFEKMLPACADDEFCKGVATFYLGRTHLELAQYDRALESLQNAEDIFTKLGKDNERAKVFHVRARVYSQRSEFSEALNWFGRAEEMLASGPQKDTQELFQLWMNRAKVYVYLSDYAAAEKDLENAERIVDAKSGPARKAMIAQRRGWILAEQQRFPEAEKYYATALTLFDQTGNLKEKASVLNNLAHIDETKADYPKALERYRDALRLSKEFSSPAEQAFILNNMGNVQRKRGDYDNAVRLYNEALTIRKKLDIKQFYAETLNNLGIVYLAYGDYAKAFGHFRECFEVSEKTKSKSGKAWALHNMAWVYKDQGSLMKSQQCSLEAISLAEEINNRRLLATAVLRLGNLEEYYGNFEGAIAEYERAARIQSAIGDRFFLSNTYFDLGTAFTRNGLAHSAEEKFKQAVDLKDKIGAPKGESLCKFALFFLEKNRYIRQNRDKQGNRGHDLKRARDLLKQADTAIGPEEKNDRMLLTYVWGRLLLEENPNEAVTRFQELRSLANSVGSLKYSFLASTGLGLAYEKMRDWSKAEIEFERAVNDAERIRETLDPYLKKTFLRGEEILGVKHVLPYQGLARVRMLKGDKEGSFKAAEFTKARAFADKLAQRIGGASFGVDRKLSDELYMTEARMGATYKRLEECRAGGGDRTLVGKLEAERDQLEKRFERIKLEIKRHYPNFYAVRFPTPTPLDRSTLKPDELALIYEVTDTGILIYLTKGKTMVEGLFKPVAKRDLDGLVNSYRRPLEYVGTMDDLSSFKLEPGEKLFGLLVKDMLPHLAKGAAVIVVPDGALAVLPFEMLPTAEGGRIDDNGKVPTTVGAEFFGDRNRISYWQSITALTLARNRSKGSKSPDKMLVVANPVPARRTTQVSSRAEIGLDRKREIDSLMKGEPPPDRAGGSRAIEIKLLSPGTFAKLSGAFGPLEETQCLADDVKKRLGEGKVDVFTGKDATIRMFRQKVVPHMDSYKNVLFATHGYFGREFLPEVDEPILLLSMVPDRADNLLRMSEVMELDMDADIVTLLACRSGLGEDVSGEGTMGMGRAFQYAGAKSVLMSLWNVSVDASVTLADVFLAKLQEGKGKLEALQEARKEIRKAGYDHPFFWASFILVGEIN